MKTNPLDNLKASDELTTSDDPHTKGCKHLYAAIIEWAVRDLTHALDKPDRKWELPDSEDIEKCRKRAKHWFLTDESKIAKEQHEYVTFIECCEILELNPNYIIKELKLKGLV